MRSVKEILANEKFQADKRNDFAFEGLVLTGFLHLPGIKKSLQCVVGVEPDQDGNQWEHVSVKFCGTSLKASNFIDDGIAGGVMWTGKRSGRDKGVPKELKRRWVYEL